MKYILAFETSCDDTSIALIDEEGNIFKNLISSQLKVHKPYGGVVPEIASREHLKNIIPLYEKIFLESSIGEKDLVAIGSTMGPGLIGSVLVGYSFAKALAYSLSIPFYGINHIEAHLYSPFIEKRDLPFPSLILVVSGGHSHLFLALNFEKYYLIAATRDDAAGEAFDKVGKKLKIPYPQGPKVDKLARKGNDRRYKFPTPKIKNGLDFSFSGLKTAFMFTLEKNSLCLEKFDEENLPLWVYDILASFEKSVVNHLIDRIEKAIERFKPKSIGVAGGVAANTLLRQKIIEISEKKLLPFSIPKIEYCTDNAAMVAFKTYLKWKNGSNSDFESDAFATFDFKKYEFMEEK